MTATKLSYLENPYQKTSEGIIKSIDTSGPQPYVILDKTIFYPQGGGQPSDRGVIEGPEGKLTVTHVSYNQGLPQHLGKLEGNLTKGDKVIQRLDWDTRYLHMQWHTAGHLLDEAVKLLMPEYYGVEGEHGIGNRLFVVFSGFIDASHSDAIQNRLNELISENLPITSRMVTKKEIEEEHIPIPFKLPENKPLRLIQIGSLPPVPDGGTQLKTTGESWPISIVKIDYQDSKTVIHYQVQKPANVKVSLVPQGTTTFDDFRSQADAIIANLDQLTPGEAARTQLLGKKGALKELTSTIPQLPPANKAAAGKLISKVRQSIESWLSTKTESAGETPWLDITQPGSLPPQGHLHPITQAIEEITTIFERIGFTRVRYPEVDYDWFVFEALNMPQNHPARDEWETFFINAPKHPKWGEMVLTTHTSNGQPREMLRVKKPPIRMLNIGKCYRRQQDVTHTAMFHQFEGLVIDEGITIQHLKGTLDYFARKFYGPNAKSRIRPFMFKFTEPSFEVDFSCTHCDGKGCRFCKSGWHEVGGAGMVHPNVLKAGGVDPEKYTGFAFGWGVERVYTLKPGLKLDDIRPLYGNDVKFLAQF